ncbi:collagen alpha-6(VI) chain-like [Haliotis cracherodii]|uniref:collagen alpha-6(VI) chain-like n=1 Tax=Haliotis cracherodii TaxID=6455 RepID=UPI0039EC6B47
MKLETVTTKTYSVVLAATFEDSSNSSMGLVLLLDSPKNVRPANFNRLKKCIIEVVNDTSFDDGKVRVGVVTFSSSSKATFEDSSNSSMGLVLLLDSPKNVRPANFNRLKKCIIEVVNDTSFDDGKVRVGVVTFSSSSKATFEDSSNSSMDLVLLLDSPKKVRPANFNRLKKCIIEVVNDTNFDDGKAWVGVVTFSSSSKATFEDSSNSSMGLVLLLDSPKNVRPANFNRLKKCIIEVVNDTSFDDGKVRVGVVTFSSSSKATFEDSSNSSMDLVLLLDSPKKVRPANFNRLKKCIIEVVNDTSFDDGKAWVGVVTFSSSSKATFEDSSNSSMGLVLLLDSPKNVRPANFNRLKKCIIEVVNDTSFDDGKVRVGVVTFSSSSKATFEDSSNSSMGLVLLLDSTKNVRPANFNRLKKCIIEVVNDTSFDDGKVRVGVVTFSSSSKATFEDSSNSSMDLVLLLDSPKKVRPANFNRLKKCIIEVVNDTNFDDGKAWVGVVTFSSSSKATFEDSSNSSMGLVLLLDSPKNVRPANFNRLKKCIIEVVNDTSFDDGKVRVGVVTFSSSSKATFEDSSNSSMDLVLLLDSPKKVRPANFNRLKKCIIEVVNDTSFDDGKAWVGVVTFSSSSKATFEDSSNSSMGLVLLLDSPKNVRPANFNRLKKCIIEVVNDTSFDDGKVRVGVVTFSSSSKATFEDSSNSSMGLVLLLDSPKNVRPANFNRLKKCIIEVVNDTSFDDGKVRVGVVTFSSSSKATFEDSSNSSMDLVLLLDSPKKVRPANFNLLKKCIIEVVNDTSFDDGKAWVGVVTFSSSSKATFEDSSNSSMGLVLLLDSPKNVRPANFNRLKKCIIEVVNDTSFDDGKVRVGVVTFSSSSKATFEDSSNSSMGLVLLLDSPKNVRPANFNRLKKCIIEVVNDTSFDDGKVRVGVVTFSSSSKATFEDSSNSSMDLVLLLDSPKKVRPANFNRLKKCIIEVVNDTSFDDGKAWVGVVTFSSSSKATFEDSSNSSMGLVLLLDSPKKVRPANFNRLKKCIIEVVNDTSFDDGKVRVGVVTFSSSSKATFEDSSNSSMGLVLLLDSPKNVRPANFNRLKKCIIEVVNDTSFDDGKVRVGVVTFSSSSKDI